MNLRSTALLVVLVAAVGLLWWKGPDWAARWQLLPPQAAPGTDPVAAYRDFLAPDRLDRVEVRAAPDADPVVLAREPGEPPAWALPGHWPVRKAEADDLIGLLTGLSSRFRPVALGETPDLTPYGLDPSQKPVTVAVKAGDQTHTLAFGQPDAAAEDNPFTRPTYLRVDDAREVVQLGPGLLDVLKRPRAFYQKRQLFPEVKRVRLTDARPVSPQGIDAGAAPTPLLDVAEVVLDGPCGRVALTHQPEPATGRGAVIASGTTAQIARAWALAKPVHDRPDPDKLKEILTAVPDIWVEHFLPAGDATRPEKTGLDHPAYTLTVRPWNGTPLTIQIGKISREKKNAGPPPPPNPFAPPPPPKEERETFRYAKLADNPQVFEVKADKFADLFAEADKLRDARLDRFLPADVVGLEVEQGGPKIVLVREKKEKDEDPEHWRLQAPVQASADATKVTELLDRLAELQARDQDVHDKADAKEYGFAPAPRLTLTVRLEEDTPPPADAGPDAKPVKKPRTVVFELGKHDTENAKQYVRVRGRERINAVPDAPLDKLAERSALAYRGKRPWPFEIGSGQIARLTVERPGETYQLEQAREPDWKLTQPVAAEPDKAKASHLADEVARLEVVEYVNDAPKDADLTTYGLDKPGLTLKLKPADTSKPEQTLRLGKAREGKPEVYARLDGGTGVFTLKKEFRDQLDQGALALLPLQLWQLTPDAIAAVQVQKGAGGFDVRKEGGNWRIKAPFDAPAGPTALLGLLEALVNLRAERYETFKAKALADYGLDKPYLTVRFTAEAKPDPAAPAPPAAKPKERTLLVGKPTAADLPTRFAKLADGDTLFVVGEQIAIEAGRDALDLLDRTLLRVEGDRIAKVVSDGASAPLTLQREGDGWKVEGTPSFPADREVAATLVRLLANLHAQRFVAYGPKTDSAKYGLDKPERTVRVTVKPAEGAGAAAKPTTHTLALGKQVPDAPDGERYARLDDGPGIAVLGATAAGTLSRTPLDYADRTLLTFDPAGLTSLRRQMAGQQLELNKVEEAWAIAKPAKHLADASTLDDLTRLLSRLRASRVVSLAAKDPKKYGLDEPAATVTLVLNAGGKETQRVLQLGKPAAAAADGERYVQVDGSATVAVLPAELSQRLLAEPIKFRDRAVARFTDADKVVLTRSERKATFARPEGNWKMTEPIAADAEQTGLDDLLSAMARLRAAELVADKSPDGKPVDLKLYGLDKPEASWRFLADDKEVLHLLVGAAEKNGVRRYAKLAGNDLVFLLDVGLSQRVLAEYRKRSLDPIDASMVDVLTLSTPNGTHVLRKEGGAWQVQGQPERKVKAAAVEAVLATLAGLRVERFVLDKGANPKLYGLDPPQYLLIVQTRMGGLLRLQLGGLVDKSKQRYASVPDPKRSDVFVLSEADSAKLAVDLPDLTQK